MKFEKLVRKDQDELYDYVSNALSSMKYKVVKENGFVYAEGEIPVMVVAHLDTVHKNLPSILFYSEDRDKITAIEGIGGDDRCGVYMIFKLLEKIRPYVLFVKDEEVGGIGSMKFTKSGIKPNINYIVEFDRKGNNDAVFYDGTNEEFIDFVTSFGFKEKTGSYTDICDLCPYVGCAGVNLSSGYYNPHTTNEFVSFKDMEDVINRSLEMIETETDLFEWESDIVYENFNDAKNYGCFTMNGRNYYNYDYYNHDYSFGQPYDYDYYGLDEEDTNKGPIVATVVKYVNQLEHKIYNNRLSTDCDWFMDEENNLYCFDDIQELGVRDDKAYILNNNEELCEYEDLLAEEEFIETISEDDYMKIYW